MLLLDAWRLQTAFTQLRDAIERGCLLDDEDPDPLCCDPA
jgi:hypothetical protein